MQPLIPTTELPTLPKRAPDSNKGTFGRVLIVAGSRGMSGAAILCAWAALRSGSGLVRVAVPQSILDVVAMGNPCYTLAALPEDSRGAFSLRGKDELLALARANDVVAMGPGIGQSDECAELVQALIQETDKPLVLDADALNVLANRMDCLSGRAAPLILTPHPGEFARLVKTDVPTIQANRQQHAADFARERVLILLLKGHRTVVTDGERVYVNETGNPGMAKGGSGDVLTGVLAALLGQGLAPFEATQLGAWLHGRAGDLARDVLGQRGMIATDLLNHLPAAFAERAE